MWINNNYEWGFKNGWWVEIHEVCIWGLWKQRKWENGKMRKISDNSSSLHFHKLPYIYTHTTRPISTTLPPIFIFVFISPSLSRTALDFRTSHLLICFSFRFLKWKEEMAKNVGILAMEIYFPPSCIQQVNTTTLRFFFFSFTKHPARVHVQELYFFVLLVFGFPFIGLVFLLFFLDVDSRRKSGTWFSSNYACHVSFG